MCLLSVHELNQVPKPGHSYSFNNSTLILLFELSAILITSLHTSLIFSTFGHVTVSGSDSTLKSKPVPRHCMTSKHATGLQRQLG